MDLPFLIFAGVFLLIGGRILYGRLKYGSWTGSFLKGSIERSVGEVKLSGFMAMSQKIEISRMRRDSGEEFVALVVKSTAPMGASMQPYKLSTSQALELADYLTQAARD